jgi:hypothetical protein
MLWLTLAGLTAVLAYLVGTPYTVLDKQEFLLQFKTQMAVGDVRGIGKPLAPIPEQMLAALNQGFGPLPLALAVVGLVAGLWRAPRVPTLVIAAFPAVYLAYMLPKSWFVPRVLQPVLPAFALLAAAGIVVLARRAPPRWRGLALGLLLVAASGQSVVYSLYHNWVLSQTDTRVLAHQWMQANLPPGSYVLVEPYTVLDQLEPIPNPADLRFEYFVARPTDDQFDVLLADGVDYYLSSSLFFRRYNLDPATTRTQARSRTRFYGMLAQRGRQLRTIVPTRDGREPPYTGEDTKSPFWNLLSYARPGPTLRLYALKKPDSGAGRSPAGSSGG